MAQAPHPLEGDPAGRPSDYRDAWQAPPAGLGDGWHPGPRALPELRKPRGRPHHTLWPQRGAQGGVGSGRGAEAGTPGLPALAGRVSPGQAGLAAPVGAPRPAAFPGSAGGRGPRAPGKALAAEALLSSGVRLCPASPALLASPAGSHALSGRSTPAPSRVCGPRSATVWPPPLPERRLRTAPACPDWGERGQSGGAGRAPGRQQPLGRRSGFLGRWAPGTPSGAAGASVCPAPEFQVLLQHLVLPL